MKIFILLDEDGHIIKELYNASQIDEIKIDNAGCYVSFKDGMIEHILPIQGNSFEYKDENFGIKSNFETLWFTNNNWETCALAMGKEGIYAEKLSGKIIGG